MPNLEKRPEKKTIAPSFETVEEWERELEKVFEGKETKIYTRYGYPELLKKENEFAKMLGLEEGELLLYNSGMAALRESIESQASQRGETILYSPAMYQETVKYIEEDLKERGVKVIPFNSGKIEEIKELIEKYHPKFLICETVGNAPEMPVVDIEKLLDFAEEINEKYLKEYSLENILEKQLSQKPWLRTYFEKISPQEKEDILKRFKETAKEVSKKKTYFPLRRLVRLLEEKGWTKKEERRNTLLELKSLLDTASLAAKEKGFTLILDNTLPTPSGLPLASQIKERKVKILVAESGTKFYGQNRETLGVIYSNDHEEILRLRELRMRTGTYLPKTVLENLPELTKESFEERNLTILRNTKLLAQTLATLEGKHGIKAVSHPNLPSHPNFEYAEKKFPQGAAPLFYVLCKDSFKVAKLLKEKLKDKIEIGGSFGLDKTRILPLKEGILRIAGGRESEEEILEILEEIKKI